MKPYQLSVKLHLAVFGDREDTFDFAVIFFGGGESAAGRNGDGDGVDVFIYVYDFRAISFRGVKQSSIAGRWVIKNNDVFARHIISHIPDRRARRNGCEE